MSFLQICCKSEEKVDVREERIYVAASTALRRVNVSTLCLRELCGGANSVAPSLPRIVDVVR